MFHSLVASNLRFIYEQVLDISLATQSQGHTSLASLGLLVIYQILQLYEPRIFFDIS